MEQLERCHPSEIRVGDHINHAGADVKVIAVRKTVRNWRFDIIYEYDRSQTHVFYRHTAPTIDMVKRYESQNPRCSIEISIVELDDNGDVVKERDGVSFDLASTQTDLLAEIMEAMYETGCKTLEVRADQETLSERRPADE